MNSKYLVINGGSSSLKFSLYEMPSKEEIVSGIVEKIGLEDSFYSLKFNGEKVEKAKHINNHTGAIKTVLEELLNYKFINDLDEIKGVGHRILHGGEYFSDSVVVDDDVIEKIESLTELGPLHIPGEVACIKSMKEVLPEVKQVAVFDTAFHQTNPDYNYRYAIPNEFYEKYGVRKYGFHGTSYKYITNYMKKYYNKDSVNLIICHVGSGASIAAIKDGKSLATSMELTPNAGLMMGTRCGNIDASVIPYLMKQTGKSADELNDIFNKQSGLLGVSGVSDFRDLLSLIEKGDKNAILAYNMYKERIIEYISMYYGKLRGKVDAIIFTAGVLENNPTLRGDIVNDISTSMHVSLNKEVNNNIGRNKKYSQGKISNINSYIDVFVIPTDEESIILDDTYSLEKDNKKYMKRK